jgi:hypothetical protein
MTADAWLIRRHPDDRQPDSTSDTTVAAAAEA